MEATMSEQLLEEILLELRAVRAELADMKTRSADGWQRTPEGLPICPKHNVVMAKREKQGDTWYSHKIETPDGDEYCRGYATKNGTAWHVEAVSKQGVSVNGKSKRPIGFQAANATTDLKPGDYVRVRGNSGIRQGVVDSVADEMVCVLIEGKPYNLSIDRIV
jgi:hypothetical protein